MECRRVVSSCTYLTEANAYQASHIMAVQIIVPDS